MKSEEIQRIADNLLRSWLCHYGQRNANLLSKRVRRSFREYMKANPLPKRKRKTTKRKIVKREIVEPKVTRRKIVKRKTKKRKTQK